MVKKIVANSGNVYAFVANTWESRNAWGHECSLYLNDVLVANQRARYYNRTWEAWQYRTVMLCAIEKLQNGFLDAKCNEYKKLNGKTRLPKGYRKKCEEDPKFKELAEVYDKLRSC